MNTNLYQITYQVPGQDGLYDWETRAETARDAIHDLRAYHETYADVVAVYRKIDIGREFWG